MQIVRAAEDSSKTDKSFREEEGIKNIHLDNVIYGLAVDIGTTTVVMALYDIVSGKKISELQQKNRQTLMGADVMMRLMHCSQGRQEKLEQLIRDQIQDMAVSLCRGICGLCEIKKAVVVGNTTMCHIFLGKDTSGLAGSPFKPAYQGNYKCLGQDLNMEKMTGTEFVVPAGADAHVGADAVAMLTSLELPETQNIVLAVDIGTNAEIALSVRGKLLTCSAPAGPAFEGARIFQGMRGEPGAIAGVRIAKQSGNIILDVIAASGRSGKGGLPVRGICGSGLIDAVAALCQCGVIRRDGYLLTGEEAESECLPDFLKARMSQEGFCLFDGEDGKRVLLTQHDVRQFQLAKAAVQAGIRILLWQEKIALEKVDMLYIAGVFGGHITKKNAIATGLFPNIDPEKIQVVGNAAGQGAAKALLEDDFLEKLEQAGKNAGHVELAQQEKFQQEFLDAMQLTAWN